MSNSVEVSLIMACYNAEKYIAKTLDTVCNQTFKNYEIICVNDGSSDNTLRIIEEYQQRYPNIVVISRENNEGKNVTRLGLKHAKGRYVCTADNDDYVSERFIEELYNTITKNDADIAVCGYQRESFETGAVISKEMNKSDRIITVADDYGALLSINSSLWNKMFKSDVIKSILDTDEELYSMDMIYLAYAYLKAKKIAFTKDVLYYYQIRQGSGINVIKNNHIEEIYNALLEVKKHYISENEAMLPFLDAYAFLHLGVSLLYRVFSNDRQSFNDTYKKNIEFLDKNFGTWKRNKYYGLKYVVSHKGANLKLLICNLFYRINQFELFMQVYAFVTNQIKIEIKW